MASTAPSENRIIKVSVVSDVTCPWCYIGSKEIDRAIQKLQLPANASVKFELEHKPYLLNPTWKPDEWWDKRKWIVERHGKDGEKMLAMTVGARGRQVGIDFIPGGYVCSTWRAHRLLLLAWNKGGSQAQSKLLKKLYAASFELEVNIVDIDVLATYAEECGFISKNEAVEFLKSTELTEEVQRMVSSAHQSGVTGVPFTVIDGRWAISGGQSVDVYYQIFHKLVQGKDP